MNKLFIAIALAIIAVLAFFSYRWFYREAKHELVIIYPDHSTTKIKPQDVNNNISPTIENTIYDNFKAKKFSNRKVNLLPEPEQPINIIANNHKDDVQKKVIDPIDLIIAEIANNEQNKSTLTIDDNIFPELLSENNSNQEVFDYNVTNLSKENNAKKQEIEVIENNNETYKNIKITKVNENNKLNHYATKQNNHGFKIQLASVKSENLGKIEGERIQKKFPKILGQSTITVQKTEPEKNKVFYLIFAGTFSNISKAKAACRKLSSKGQTCIVAR